MTSYEELLRDENAILGRKPHPITTRPTNTIRITRNQIQKHRIVIRNTKIQTTDRFINQQS